MWEIRVGWVDGGPPGWPCDEEEEEDFPRRLPKMEPRREEELGAGGWPREEHSWVVTLRRMWGLLMVDPCGRKKRDEEEDKPVSAVC